jgi:hypothetical protein
MPEPNPNPEPEPRSTLALLNVFEIERDGAVLRLLCFIDPVLAGARGIDGRSVLGEIDPSAAGGLEPGTLQINPDFIEAFEQYMNEEGAHSADLVDEARNHPSDWLYIIDSRHPAEPDDEEDPPASEVVGCFAVDDTGQIVPRSFQYNRNHLWIHPEFGPSSILASRPFYDWLHRDAGT